MTIKQNMPILIMILFLGLSTVSLSAEMPEGAKTEAPFCLKTIVLDPGHGGKDPGNVGSNRIKEKHINLQISLKLAELLREKTEYEVYLTRTTDQWISLSDRTSFANQFSPEQTLFISIHCNSHPNATVHGLESYIFNLQATDKLAARLAQWENAEEIVNPIDFIVNNLYQRGSDKYSWEAARITQSVLVSYLKSRDRNRSASDKTVRRAPFRVLVDTKMPALLVELGYLSNREEYKKLSSLSYQNQVANALLASIQEFDRVARTYPKKENENAPFASVE